MAYALAPLGDSALVVRVGDSLGEVLGTAQLLAKAELPGVVEIVPAFASVAVFLASPSDLDRISAKVATLLEEKNSDSEKTSASRLVEIPVCYAPAFGLDLETVARHTHLSPHEIVRGHSGGSYQVRCVGFTPGFPYLSGLPRALATPRRETPRVEVPAGSVAIGGAQTGVYPLPSPGGWNVIGRTPLILFDSAREPAALLRAGDRVRFVPITEGEFARWAS